MIHPKNLLTFKEVKSGIENYYKNIPLSYKKFQTRSVWFDFEEIKNYISYIEEISKNKEIEISGIRIHLIGESNAPKKINLAICPTVELKNSKGEIINPSFDPLYSQKGTPVLLDKLLTENKMEEETSIVLNRGGACPVICPTQN